MPRLDIEATHSLGEEEALRPMKGKMDMLKHTFRDRFSDLREEWNGSSLSFAFKAAGMKVAGTITADDSQVKLAAQLPFAAMMFKGMIKTRVDRELGKLLA